MSAPVVLDVTRSLSPKSILFPTGIDRVERAYIRHFLTKDAHFVARVGKAQTVFDREAMKALWERINGMTPWGKQDLRGFGRGFKGQVSSDIRRLSSINKVNIPNDFTYLNVGHTNLSDIPSLKAKHVVGMVHDLIPLTHPEFQTPASVERFKERIAAITKEATTLLVNSAHTKKSLENYLTKIGISREIVVNHLGIDPLPEVEPQTGQRPGFVILGSIEPRKNHALLLKVWEQFTEIPEEKRPLLHIIGRRGWLNEDVFKTLDTSPLMGRDIIEHPNLSDAEISAILRGANALLFPSFTEGYGLPLLEALSVQTPVIASDIPAFREIGGALSLYLNPYDASVWINEIKIHSKQVKSASVLPDLSNFSPPSWSEHFEKLDSILMGNLR